MSQVVVAGSTKFQLIDILSDMDTLSDEKGLVLAKTAKGLHHIERYLAGKHFNNIVELGIFRGGSVAFYTEMLSPRKIVAIDINESCDQLDTWINLNQKTDIVKPYFGIEQTETDKIRQICDEEFGSGSIDLIIDDCSHELEKTRESFNSLFPLLRPGGIYIIEDWAWYEFFSRVGGTFPPAVRPLSTLVHECVIASALGEDVIEEVVVNEWFAAVKRGAGAIAPPFDISDYQLGGSRVTMR